MTDIRDAVARALCDVTHAGADYGMTTDDVLDDPRGREYWFRLADAALSVARPLIEAEARERALREAAAAMNPMLRSLISRDQAQRAILALLPAPAEEAEQVERARQEMRGLETPGSAMWVAAARQPATSDDGWIPWGGGECPVERNTRVDVIFRNDVLEDSHQPAHYWFWGRSDKPAGDIVAYRIVEADRARDDA